MDLLATLWATALIPSQSRVLLLLWGCLDRASRTILTLVTEVIVLISISSTTVDVSVLSTEEVSCPIDVSDLLPVELLVANNLFIRLSSRGATQGSPYEPHS